MSARGFIEVVVTVPAGADAVAAAEALADVAQAMGGPGRIAVTAGSAEELPARARQMVGLFNRLPVPGARQG